MTSPLAAILYGPDDDCDALLAAFAHDLTAAGVRVAGLVQINGDSATCDTLEMELEDLATGTRFDICQDLGAGSVGACRLDPAGLAAASAALRQALSNPVDLVVINKFGRMEADGQGLIDEIEAAVADGMPLVIGVPRRFEAVWAAYAEGLETRIACDRSGLDGWWAAVRARVAAESGWREDGGGSDGAKAC